MDWYKSAKEIMPKEDVCILTDLIEGEGYKKIVNKTDQVYKLIILDKFLFKKQTHIGNIWRNAIKLIIFPLQVLLIIRFSKKHPAAVYHAHSMYYLFLAWASGIKYVGTPQGSDILIKPYSSKLYKFFAVKSLIKASAVTVDSMKMKEKVFELSGVNAFIIQNGIDLKSINEYFIHNPPSNNRNRILSIRGLTPLYRIKELVEARNSSKKLSETPFTFIYPFYEQKYLEEIRKRLNTKDVDLGRIDRMSMYNLLSETLLVISIPDSDSSPRSVYEAIFCGCVVAITYHPYYNSLPQCMKSRILVIDLNKTDWLEVAIDNAKKIIEKPFIPSEEALDMFDQRRSFKLVEKLLFYD